MSTTYTTNYHLGKQTDTSDNFDMSVITDNMDIIDTQMKSNENNISLISKTDRWTTRKNIYGISFNTTDSSATCTRIADASLLNNDYLVGGVYVNGGNNDFDDIFPWCEMRLCNVKYVNGVKVITYEGETGFTRDGTNGNVMVEVPAFYFKRERINNVETWAYQ